MKRIPGRAFIAEFKAEAFKLVTEQKPTHTEVSRKLDIAPHSLRTWIDQQARGTLKASLGDDQLRIRELERDLAIAKMERDCSRRLNIDSPCRFNIDPGAVAAC
jgi:transposase-like protein